MRVRTLEEKDLKEIPRLFEKVYQGYSLYNREVFELYQHFVNGDNGKEFMFVVEDDNTLAGYCAVGVREVGPSAMISIYDIVAVNKKGYDMLMGKVEEIGNEREASLIEVSAPLRGDAAEYLKSKGFLKTRTIAAMVWLCDMKAVLTLFVEKAVRKERFGKDVTILFCTDEERIRVKLPEGVVDSGEEADIEIVISRNDLLSLLLKRSGCFSLVLKRRMRVRLGKVVSVCKVVDYLAEDVKMVTPFIELM